MPSLFRNLFFLFFFINQLAAQEVNIALRAPGYTGKKVTVWIEDDLITGHQSLVETKIIENEKADLKVKLNEINLIRISLDYQYGLMLIEPGTSYQVVFPFPEDRSELSLAGTARIRLIYKDLDSLDINYKLAGFNADVDDFLYENLANVSPKADSVSGQGSSNNDVDGYAIDRFSEREMINKVEEYRGKMDSIYSDNSNYFTTYRKFVFANLEYSLGVKRRKVYFEFLENVEVAYNNVEFVKFFKTFYADFFDFYSYYPYSEKLVSAFESDHPIEGLLNIIGGDTLTGTDEIQHLILQKGLFDLYPKTSRWKSRIIEILERLKTENPYPEQRLIANNMVGKLLKGKKGTPAPEMRYLKANGDTSYLSDFNGKLVYIQFFAVWNTSAVAEMELMEDLRKRYGNLVEFVSISIDEDFEDFISFTKKNKEFKWAFGWIGDDPELLKDYEITHLPLFYLFDEQGRVVSWPALWPSTGVESIFHKTKYNRKNKKKKGYWDSPPNKSNKDG